MSRYDKISLEEGIKTLTDEKKKIIAEKICEAQSLINSVEVQLIGTPLEDHSLIFEDTPYSLWQQLYHLQKKFED